jgi:AcrR family transcriptional regulator
MECSQIAQKAHALFSHHGIKCVTMNDIAANLGVSKKTIYKFFVNKDALVGSFIEQEISENIVACQRLTDKSSDTITALFLILLNVQTLYIKLNSVIVHELKRCHYAAYLRLENHKKVFIYQAIKTNINKGIQERLYREDFNVEMVAHFFLESQTLVSSLQKRPLKNVKNPHSTENILKCLIYGITTSLGAELIGTNKIQIDF